MTRKLIPSFKSEEVLIKSDRLKWLLEKGLVITKIDSYIRAKRGRPNQKFLWIKSRKGDVDPDHAIIAEM